MSQPRHYIVNLLRVLSFSSKYTKRFILFHFFFALDDFDSDSDSSETNVNFGSNIGVSPIHIDPSYYYRLTNAYSGQNLALDIVNDGRNYALKMTPISDHSGQFWTITHLGNDAYKLQTLFLKYRYSLDIVNDGVNNKPHMAETGDFAGQYWHLTPQNDGTFKLSNEFSGNNKFLDVYRNNGVAFMGNNNNDYSGQHWRLHKIRKINNY